MDPEEKRKLANEKRLQAIKQWKKNQTINNVKVKNAPKKESRNDLPKISNKLTLFHSDDEEEKFDDCFKIRPQFEGHKGQQLLEMSSQFSSRFKLDERFRDDDEQLAPEENDERTKNLKILESVIGHEVRKLPADMKKKRQIRFDPEDERSTKYVKTSEVSSEKPKKKRKEKKSQNSNDCPEEIPISSERYIEVTANLKDILNSSGPFSLSQKFSCNNEPENNHKEFHTFKFTEKKSEQDNTSKSTTSHLKNDTGFQKSNTTLFEPRVKSEPFFISEDDPRLKEGVEFFMRTKPLDELREEWKKRREVVLEIFRRKKKSSHKKPPKVKSKNVSKYNKK